MAAKAITNYSSNAWVLLGSPLKILEEGLFMGPLTSPSFIIMMQTKTAAPSSMGRIQQLFGHTALAAAVATGGALIVTSVSPVKAQPTCANGNGTSYLTGLSTVGCQIGDKLYSDFSFSPNWSSSGTFNFTNIGDKDHTFSAAGLALLSGSYTYTYKMTALADQLPLVYRTDLGTSGIDPVIATNALANSANGNISTAGIPGASPGNLVNLNSPNGISPVTFTGSLTVTDGRIDTFTDSVRQSPGPLPILGAGAAFGFSRKLRGRIKAARLG